MQRNKVKDRLKSNLALREKGKSELKQLVPKLTPEDQKIANSYIERNDEGDICAFYGLFYLELINLKQINLKQKNGLPERLS